MDEKELNAKLRELVMEMVDLPKDKQKQLDSLVEKTKQRHKDIKKNVDEIAMSLRSLRVCIKYLLFDLEATRRERDSLKKMLNGQSTDDDKPSKTDSET